MKIGSRPIARIASTGELTPPGRTSSARLYNSAERVSVSDAINRARSRGVPQRHSSSIFPLPVLEVLGEVQQADLLELGRGVERRALVDSSLLGDRVEHRVALLLGASVRHREHRVRPILIRGALVAVGDATHAG